MHNMNKIFRAIHFEWKNSLMRKFTFRQVSTRNIILFCFLCIFILLWGCKSSSESDSEDILTIEIEINKDKISFPLSEITEKIDVIELETNDNSFIGSRGILHVDTLENYYIVFDGSPGVLVFDSLGNFIRRIGRRGQGPGELTAANPCQIDYNNGTIMFNDLKKRVVYDINGKHIEDIYHDMLLSILPLYYLNDSIFYIDESWENISNEFFRTVYFNIYNYSNGNFLANLVDSIFVNKSKPLRALDFNMTFWPFQHQGQVYFYIQNYYEDSYVYVYRNHQFERFAKFVLKTNIRNLSVTDRYLIAEHGYIVHTGDPGPTVITPDMFEILRLSSRNRENTDKRELSYYVYDYKTGKSIDSYHGFIDDIHHTNDTIPIKFIDGGEKFFYTREHDYSEALGTEPNPTLYIGTFKKKE